MAGKRCGANAYSPNGCLCSMSFRRMKGNRTGGGGDQNEERVRERERENSILEFSVMEQYRDERIRATEKFSGAADFQCSRFLFCSDE